MAPFTSSNDIDDVILSLLSNLTISNVLTTMWYSALVVFAFIATFFMKLALSRCHSCISHILTECYKV